MHKRHIKYQHHVHIERSNKNPIQVEILPILSRRNKGSPTPYFIGLSKIGGKAIQAATALRALVEIRYGEVGGGNPDGELELVAAPDNLNDIDPEEEHLDTYPTEVSKPIL